MKRLITAAAAACAFPAAAVLVEQGTTTLDTVSGLEWLDLSASTGLSFASVASQTGAGGRFDGWRHATAADAQGIFIQMGFPITSYLFGADTAAARAVFDSLLGLNIRGSGTAYAFAGTVADGIAGYAGFYPVLSASPMTTQTAFNPADVLGAAFFPALGGAWLVSRDEVNSAAASTVAYGGLGHFLVRDAIAPIPEPETYALLLAGLAVMGAAARRRR